LVNVRCAISIARFVSTASALATVANFSLVAGLIESNVSFVCASTYSPLINNFAFWSVLLVATLFVIISLLILHLDNHFNFDRRIIRQLGHSNGRTPMFSFVTKYFA